MTKNEDSSSEDEKPKDQEAKENSPQQEEKPADTAQSTKKTEEKEPAEFLSSIRSFKHKRVKCPTVLQMEVVECGAAALSIVLSYYKRYVTLEELRIATGVSSDGVKALSIVKAAKIYGLECKAFKKNIQSIVDIKPPFIVFWNFNHFLVVEGFSKKGVFLNDPATGPRRCSFKEFSNSYTGLVLTLEKLPEFEPGGSPPSVFLALKKRLTGVYSTFLFLGLAQFALLIPGLASIAFTQVFIDNILIEKHLDWRWYLIVSMMVALLIHVVLIWMRGRCLYRLNAKIAIRLSAQFFFHILKLPLNFYQQRASGDLAYRLQLNDTVINTITSKISRATLNLMLVGVYLVMLFFYSPAIAYIGIFEASVSVAALLFINRKRTDAMAKVMQTQLTMMGYSVAGLQSISTIKSLGLETDFFGQWANVNTKWLLAEQEFGFTNIVLSVILPFFKAMTKAALIGVGAYLVMRGSLSVGQLMAVQLVMHHFVAPIQELVGLGKDLQTTKVDLLRLDDSLNNKLDPSFEIQEKQSKENLTEEEAKLEGFLEVKDLSFGYNPTSPPIIEKFNFHVNPRETVALVGTADCGKSTIANLLSGLYQPWGGTVHFDGKERSKIGSYKFNNSVSIVDQTIQIFKGSIRENITMWNGSIPDRELINATSDACIHETILVRDHGYEYEVKEGGIDFSGGERQRLEIARALVSNPRIIILDEALSSLDAETEEKIFRNIRRRGCACVVMTNRVSSIKLCDRVVVMDRGEIVQEGTHDTLCDVEGVYKENILLKT